MAIPRRDDDPFRAMGYVAVYAAYVEEAVEECFRLLRTRDPQRRGRPWQVSAQIEWCLRAIAALPEHEELTQLAGVLQEAKRLNRERNAAIHNPLYARASGLVFLRRDVAGSRQLVTTAQIYDLAEEIFELADALRATAIRLPRILHEAASKR